MTTEERAAFDASFRACLDGAIEHDVPGIMNVFVSEEAAERYYEGYQARRRAKRATKAEREAAALKEKVRACLRDNPT